MTQPIPSLSNIISEARGENLPVLQLSEISDDLRSVLQNGLLARLKILPLPSGQTGSTILQIDDAEFVVQLKENLPQPSNAEGYTLPVKIAAGGKLQVQAPLSSGVSTEKQSSLTGSSAVKMDIDINRQLASVKVEPLKLSTTLAPKLEQLALPEGIKNDILTTLPKLDAAIVALGKDKASSADILQPLYNTIKQISLSPREEVPQLINQLSQQIRNLSGQQISAEVTSRLNDTTFIKTDLGETMFPSPLKITNGENLTLKVTPMQFAPVAENAPSKIINNFFQLFMGKNNVTSPTLDSIPVKHFLQNLFSVHPNTQHSAPQTLPPTLSLQLAENILPKIPAFNDNFLTNLVNFTAAATKGDATIWLGKDNLQNIVAQADDLSPQTVVKALNDFVSSAVKETPLWRILEIPVYAENNFSYVKLALPKQRENQENETSSHQGTRFMVETQFSHLGSFQFEGFVQKSSRNLDLILRTSQNISDDFCANIINLFKTSLYNLDYAGNIKINRQEAFVNLYSQQTAKKGIYI